MNNTQPFHADNDLLIHTFEHNHLTSYEFNEYWLRALTL